ncbi:acyl-CoA dehydrogenase [Caproiciproducens sp. NJN-50]|uniref:acyl-CoA dehydrogenase family protein n=1 Tax=Caproiciproducens sp. NJN-50 TaxID=2507162 RepID=UPI000FFE1E01|nr:acyl-CoA dehydrogenase family protein [Caproiciproducens sp. NJN-50]QAT49097.1 acyl-CoA dehydrogenase [Caproiciproducens sp. NJN-50]
MVDRIMNEEQRDIVDLAKGILEKELVPQLEECDKTSRFPTDVFQSLFKAGLYAVEVPEEYGGLGMNFETQFLLNETLGYYDTGFAFSFHAGSMSADSIFIGGTEEQKRWASEQLLAGKVFAFCLTEPAAGSDAGAITTTAKRDGDEYIINGNKTFISCGEIADYFIVAATIDKSLKHKGITLFLVEKERGVQIGKHEDKMGLRLSPTNEVIFDEIRVPADHIIGREGKGFSIVMKNMEAVRPQTMTFAAGLMMRAVDEATRFAKERTSFNMPIIKFQGLSFLLADMLKLTQVSHGTLMYIARLLDEKQPLNGMGASAKIFISESASQVASHAVQVLGGYGYIKDYPVEKLMRDAKIFEIFEGTNQIQQVVLAGLLSKSDK